MIDNSEEKKYWVRLTRACNNKCIFCLDSNSHNNTFYSYSYICKKIKKSIDKKSKAKQRLILSGGEPTVNPNFIKVIAYGKKNGFDKIQAISNGRMFSYLSFIKEAKVAGLDEITFSIHGHNKELHDKLTGIPGSFEQTLNGLKNALTLNFIVNIDIVLNNLNFPELEDIIKFFHGLGIYEFDLLHLMPYGRAWDENFDILFYDLTEMQPIFKKVLDYGQKNNLVIWCNRFPVNYFENKEYLLKDIEKKLYYEIFGERKKHFIDYLRKNKKLKCAEPKRCALCYLNNFCTQFFYYNDLLKNKQFEFQLNNLPLCISDKRKIILNLKDFFAAGKLELESFYIFYIKYLNKYKSVRCKECRQNDSCLGLDLKNIKEKGFKIINPII